MTTFASDPGMACYRDEDNPSHVSYPDRLFFPDTLNLSYHDHTPSPASMHPGSDLVDALLLHLVLVLPGPNLCPSRMPLPAHSSLGSYC